MIKLTQHLSDFIKEDELSAELERAKSTLPQLASSPMSGWLDLPADYDKSELARIQAVAGQIQHDSAYLVCIGIGGSYLGSRAVITAAGATSGTRVLYAGNSLSATDLQKVLAEIGDVDFSVNVISKSGTTLEPAIAFRILKQKLIDKYGEQGAYSRIYATTDADSGALHTEAVENGYTTFTIPGNIGGRYSVLTPVGLLPIAVAGLDISSLLTGAAEQRSAGPNSALEYAAARHLLLKKGFDIEVLAAFEPSLFYLGEWWKQLFGESEGKNGQGIFPASVTYTTDLHSLGQYLQDGRRALQETFLKIASPLSGLRVPSSPADLDGLNYLADQPLSFVSDQALAATVSAHLSGGVPITELELPDLSTHSLGALLYFFELSCAISATLLGVNPFDQPGVEAYKTNMFRLLHRP